MKLVRGYIIIKYHITKYRFLIFDKFSSFFFSCKILEYIKVLYVNLLAKKSTKSCAKGIQKSNLTKAVKRDLKIYAKIIFDLFILYFIISLSINFFSLFDAIARPNVSSAPYANARSV